MEEKTMQSEELFALADQLRELKETKKYAEQELKEITEEIDRVDAGRLSAMNSMETQNFTRNGTMFCLTNTTRASAAAGLRMSCSRHYAQRDSRSRLRDGQCQFALGVVKEQTAENEDILPSWLDGLVNVFVKNNGRRTKAAR
jgi:hypothetical protein